MTGELIVIFGCAVLEDGRPSPSLARRIGHGVRAARAQPAALVMCSGAAGRVGPSEASVMADALIAAGVDPARIVLDEASRDTLQSVGAVLRLARAEGVTVCVACSDSYHLPRIRLMLRVLGVATRAGPGSALRDVGQRANWWRMALREALAIPYDLGLVLTKRRALMAAAGAVGQGKAMVDATGIEPVTPSV